MPLYPSKRAVLFATFLLLAGWGVAQESPDGATVFGTFCAACHQPSGQGLPGVFPPLAGHAAQMALAENGRDYLINVVLFGLQGEISVDGASYNGVMPSWFQLSDAELAAVLNHVVVGLGAVDAAAGIEPFEPGELAAARSRALSPQLVHQRRPELGTGTGETVELILASFTAEQANRVRALYSRLCEECHGESFEGGLIGGPPLSGGAFIRKWGGRPVAALFTFMRTQMPQGGPGSLSVQQYTDLVALILSVNGHQAGDVELPADPEALERLGVRSP